MRADHLELLTTASTIAVHPSDSSLVAAIGHPSFRHDSYSRQLWRISLDGSSMTRLTLGLSDSAPKISPDGDLLAFLRAPKDGRPQIHVMPLTGGEARQVTNQHLGVSDFCWSPDATTFAFTSRVAEEGRYGTTDDVEASTENPRHITSLAFQANGLGWSLDRPTQVFTIAVPDCDAEPYIPAKGRCADDESWEQFATATRLTDDTLDYSSIHFFPDGSALVATAKAPVDGDTIRHSLYRISVEPGTPVNLLPDDSTLSAWSSAFSGDGSKLYFLAIDGGESGADFVGRNAGIYVMPVAGGDPQLLTSPATQGFETLRPGPRDTVLACLDRAGYLDIIRINSQGMQEEVSTGRVVHDFAMVPGTSDVAVVFSNARTPSDIAVIRGRDVRTITDLSAALRKEAAPLPVQEFSVRHEGVEVAGFVVLPEGPGPHPALLMIHGGPQSNFSGDFHDEAQVYARAGYAAIMSNPRGSSGYGEEFSRCIVGDMGDTPMRDVLAFLEGCVKEFNLDPERLGVQGGSYGGYLTAWVIAHDHRFKGAIVERGYLDPASFIGASDIGWFFSPAYTGPSREDMDRQSPTLLSHQVKTPTFVIHSEQDLRCPLGQALRYYSELKMNGVDAELLVFPGENHELSRSGTPWHRRQRFEAILAWWKDKLG